ncbi:phosphoglycerate kinase [Ruficoccus sp. ZRK36]|uniref:phosphoglycerate kinase n=1 Tax=Ruficoccus sp. ZRK36 TaxID=2866311 RepID=UPI001C7321C1|nr:phosphoglycerate kinase [Ruficoccus sp. ZRK36]QYY35926.1 phosphoglycerate kinase [Ruficoccus sp. ZRK36]
MASVKTIKDVNLAGKRVFVRVDFNVPFDAQGNISDDTRIMGALPTIKHLVGQGAKVILASHLGRPKGEKNLKFTLAPVAKALSERLGQPVLFVPDCIGPEAEKAANDLADGGVILLENARFYKGEEKNEPEFCQALAKFADAYVNDAFGTAHRAHATTEGITKYISGPKVSGFLIEKELDFLGDKTAKPERPFTVILGGAKVSDKITVIEALLEKCDTMLIGGAMAYTFALALDHQVGSSLNEPDKIETAKACLAKAKEKGVNFLLPVDNVITDKVDFGAGTVGEVKVCGEDIPEGWQGVDIGPKTIELYKAEAAKSKTILWNGPMGIFEIKECSKGTFAVAETVAEADAISIIGGGDSVKAIKKSGYGDKVSFISTGGGASLEFLEGKTLPGVAALEQA